MPKTDSSVSARAPVHTTCPMAFPGASDCSCGTCSGAADAEAAGRDTVGHERVRQPATAHH